MATQTEQFVRVDGLKTRYLDEGKGPAIILLHGAALGSSADVWEQHLRPLGALGLRAVAFDRPGYGRTDDAPDPSPGYQRKFILQLMNALGIDNAGLIGHSQTGGFVVSLALEHPERVTRAMVVATGSVLPPLEGEAGAERRAGGGGEPTREAVRAVLEEQLYNHSLITPELVERRYQMSLGHQRAPAAATPPAVGAQPSETPLWQRLDEVQVPLLLVYGRNEPGVEERVARLRERSPHLEVRLIDRCKHLVQIDAADQFLSIATAFFGES